MKSKHFTLWMIGTIFSIVSISQAPAQTPDWDWVRGAGETDPDYATSVATDALGNLYAVGTFEGNTITFGSIILTHPGFFDMFLVKCDNSGNVLWAYNPGGVNAAAGATSVAVDPLGNVYVAGWFASASITFGTTTLINTLDPGGQARTDIFLVKFDSNGNVIWARSGVGNDFDRALSVATDTLGNVIVTGYFLGLNITFGSTTLPNAYPYFTTDLFIAKYDGNGNFLWARKAGGTAYEYITSVSIDASGNCYASGRFSSPSITFGSTTLTNAGAEGVEDMFLVKYDGSGNALWARSAGGIESDRSTSVSTDASGNNYVVGNFRSSSITFGTTTLNNPNPGVGILFIAKYDASGTAIWARSAGGIGGSNATGVLADVSGGVYLAGSFGDPSITFGSVTLLNAGFNDLFVVKYDGNGSVLWGKSAGGSESDFVNTITIDDLGNTYVAGSFYSPSINFGSITLVNANSSGSFDDIFIAKIGSGIVPVELTSFTANVNESGVTLNWSTATENNNSGFQIERINGSEYIKLGFVAGHGTITEIQNYSFIDQNINSGNYKYRLKQIDFDGTSEYSKEIEISVTMPDKFELSQNYPNPFNPSTKISWQSPVSSWQTLKVFDILGNEVAKLVDEYKPAGSYDVNFDASSLSSGVYLYKLQAGLFVETKKMLLLK